MIRLFSFFRRVRSWTFPSAAVLLLTASLSLSARAQIIPQFNPLDGNLNVIPGGLNANGNNYSFNSDTGTLTNTTTGVVVATAQMVTQTFSEGRTNMTYAVFNFSGNVSITGGTFTGTGANPVVLLTQGGFSMTGGIIDFDESAASGPGDGNQTTAGGAFGGAGGGNNNVYGLDFADPLRPHLQGGSRGGSSNARGGGALYIGSAQTLRVESATIRMRGGKGSRGLSVSGGIVISGGGGGSGGGLALFGGEGVALLGSYSLLASGGDGGSMPFGPGSIGTQGGNGGGGGRVLIGYRSGGAAPTLSGVNVGGGIGGRGFGKSNDGSPGASGVQTTVAFGGFEVTPPRWTPVDVAVDRTDNTSRLLWKETTNRYAVWKLSDTGAIQTGKYYGPATGYTCEQIVVAPNGQATLLWKNPATKQAALWTLAADLSSIVKASVYNYPANYTPQNIAADQNSDVRLSWRKTTGAVALWTITPATGAITGSAVYGPYAGLQDGPIAVGEDGGIRLLWKNTSGSGSVATLWTLPASYGAPSATYDLDGGAGGTATDVAVGMDNKARLQWSYATGANAGKTALWKIDTTVGGTGAVESSAFYNPVGGVSALGLSVGGDNRARQLWKYMSGSSTGKAALWVLDDPMTTINAGYTYGPIK